MTPDLSEDETRALAELLKRAINDDRNPLSPRIQKLRAILAKLDPSTVAPPNPYPLLPNTTRSRAPPSPAGATPAVSGAHTFSA
jgi:hypothetical protein